MDRNDGCIALSELPPGSRAQLCSHDESASIPPRLADLGLIPGTPIAVVRRAPLGDPVEVELRGYRLCLRRAEARRVCTRLDTPAE